MRSLWTESCSIPGFPSLPGDAETEVLIIGGGITGVLCAYFLEQRGIRYILVERNRISSGVTEDTTAKITVQHGLIYHKLVDCFGIEAAALYFQANHNALKTYAELCADLDCDFEWKPSYVYSMDDRELLEKEADALRKLNLAYHLQDFTELPFDVAGAIRFDQQAQFHPLKFLAAIAEKRNIFEHTHVRELKKQEAITNHGTIRFQKAIFATHFPMDNKHGLYFLKLYQHRSCMIALERAPVFNGMYVDEDRKGMSFRSYKDRLLVGGGGHRTGKDGGNWKELRAFAKRYYPEAVETMAWAAQDCMSLDQVPYIGEYSKNMPGCYVATG
ncbi:MAG: NAD(P)/FAD-dependent oxidoreductase, partial [Lachnospiraceae bacterium]